MKYFFKIVFLFISCSNLTAQDTPTLFLPQIVSSEFPEFASTITPNGKTFFFNRTSPDRSAIYLMQTDKNGKKWQKSTFAAFTDTSFREIDPFIAPNGKQVFFSTLRTLNASKSKDYNIWVSAYKGKKWQKPTPLSIEVNGNDDEVFVSVSRNGNLYFARFIAGKTGIFYSKNLNGVYQKATPLNLETDTARIINPAISPGETMLVFASGQMGGVGDADLFICYRQTDGSWSKPEGLPAPINSARADFAPSFSPYGKTLYWTSERPGIVPNFAKDKRPPGDIYHISVSTFKHN